ncbi:MAG: DNA-binding response regulator [Flavobacteriaceae bacterium]|nr:DNA-binding response regulator [Flavobacteriaceae bacterium]|tara:strand:- start:4614 stop:5252 length:639 start_codon:yes stop_codon:yes gene_type:complete
MIRVLIADHEPIVSYGIKMLFESSSDIKIVNAVNTKKQLLDYLKKGSIDVVLMTLDFADSNGISVLRNIKKDFFAVRVIIFSSQPENIYAATSIQAGASGFLSKTTNVSEIKRAIFKVFKGGIYLSNAMARKLTFENSESKKDIYSKLSTREIEVFALICNGKKNKEIAIELNINQKTVSTYKSRLMTKLQVSNIIALIDLGRQNKKLQNSI